MRQFEMHFSGQIIYLKLEPTGNASKKEELRINKVELPVYPFSNKMSGGHELKFVSPLPGSRTYCC